MAMNGSKQTPDLRLGRNTRNSDVASWKNIVRENVGRKYTATEAEADKYPCDESVTS